MSQCLVSIAIRFKTTQEKEKESFKEENLTMQPQFIFNCRYEWENLEDEFLSNKLYIKNITEIIICRYGLE